MDSKILDDVRELAFTQHKQAWYKSDSVMTEIIRKILDDAHIQHVFIDYGNDYEYPEYTCVFIKKNEKEYVKLFSNDISPLRRCPSLTPGTLLSHGKRGDKLPIVVTINNSIYEGDCYRLDSVSCLTLRN